MSSTTISQMMTPLYIVRLFQSGISGAVLAFAAWLIALFKRSSTSSYDPDAGDTPAQLPVFLTAASFSILALIFYLTPVADKRARQGQATKGVVIAALVLEVCCWVLWLAAWASMADVFGWTGEGNVVGLFVLGVVCWVFFSYTLFVSAKAMHAIRKEKSLTKHRLGSEAA